MKYRLVLLIHLVAFHAFGQVRLLHNGTIYSFQKGQWKSYEAMAIHKEMVLALGSLADLSQRFPKATKVNLEGGIAYPGFHDAHCHFLGYALTLRQANLVGTKSTDEIIEKLMEHKAKFPKQAWLTGRGWDQNDWENKAYPSRDLLDKFFPDVPVYLTRVDGHAAWANTLALKQAGINPSTQVDGGEFLKDDAGQSTGILIDNAMELVEKVIPPVSKEEKISLLLKAEQDLLAVGLTYLTDAGLDLADLQLLEELYRTGKLKIRVNAMASANEENLNYFAKKGKVKLDRFRIQSYKLYADGALGSRGACLLHPYHDQPLAMGFLLSPPKKLENIASRVAGQNFQLNTHCIGDSANRLMLQIYSRYLVEDNRQRWRIEHAQVLHPGDLIFYEKYKVIPSVQPTHATSDMYWAPERLGPVRVKTAYTYRSLLQSAGLLALGSDFPVEDIRPMFGFHAAVTRQDANNFPIDGFQSEEAISREDALSGMTWQAAFSIFEEDRLGNLDQGKKADLVVLDRDILQSSADELRTTQVWKVMINGEWVYAKP
jgi:predicted amidohydrolase YtcJ